MARGCDCDDIITCVCQVADSDCITIGGTGASGDPFIAEPILDVDPDNILECNPSGLGAFLPAFLTNPPAVLASTPITQPIANSVTTILFFNRERFDTDSMHSETTNTSRITINTAGVYAISGWAVWSGNASGERRMNIKLNGTNNIAQDERVTLQDDAFSHPFQSIWKFDVGDYFEIEVHQNSGSDLEISRAWVAAVYVAVG
jgi:hypothetical protein